MDEGGWREGGERGKEDGKGSRDDGKDGENVWWTGEWGRKEGKEEEWKGVEEEGQWGLEEGRKRAGREGPEGKDEGGRKEKARSRVGKRCLPKTCVVAAADNYAFVLCESETSDRASVPTDGHVQWLASLTTQEVYLAVQTTKWDQLPSVHMHGCSLTRLLSVMSQAMYAYLPVLKCILSHYGQNSSLGNSRFKN